ncbi:MAG: efflux RND transporter periplasmic adaptor subunit [Gemmatimonadaceae bacterium]
MTSPLRYLPAVLLLAAAAACAKPAPPTKQPVAVTVTRSTKGDAPYLIEANGIAEPMQTVAIQSQVAGVLMRTTFREGDEVKAGQLLFEIDPRPYVAALRQAEAQLARDVAQAENARRDADRFATLVQKDYVTKSQADQATANAAALAAAVDAGRANVAAAKFNADNASIRSPVSGKTGSLLVRDGNLVSPGSREPLVVINQIHPILVRFSVNERDFPLVQQYAAAHPLRVRVLGADPRVPTVEGTLSFVDNGVDTTTGTVTLKARFPNDDRKLWPGQFVRVQLELFTQPNAVLVPSQSVMTSQNGTFVFVIDEKQEAVMRPVTVARILGEQSLIEKGLESGERIVVEGTAKLAPGSKVDIKGEAAPAPVAAARGGVTP